MRGLSDVGEFVLSLIQALLKTGYYTPGHPQTQLAQTGLHQDLLKILEGRSEISFASVREQGSHDIMIDGIFEEPTRLSKLMFKGMGETFIPRFLKYFDRKHLAGFSIKAQISEEEFVGFLHLMSEHLEDDAQEENRERLHLKLIQSRILSVSTVFSVDLVGQGRNLPWRVDLALTRLKNDLSRIPLYKELNAEKLARIKAMVFEDIIRPIKVPALVMDLLVNLDLILDDTAGASGEELQDGVVRCLNERCLIAASPGLVEQYLKLRDAADKVDDDDVQTRLNAAGVITRKVARKIAGSPEADQGLLLQLTRLGLLDPGDLPENLRSRLARTLAVDAFLCDPEELYKAVGQAPKGDFAACSHLVDLVPELIERSCYDDVERIVTLSRKAGFMLIRLGDSFFEELSRSVGAHLQSAAKQGQLRIMKILEALGIDGIPVLLELISQDSRAVRRLACGILAGHRAYAVPHLMGALNKRTDKFQIRNILMVLADIGHGSRTMRPALERFVKHTEDIVREEALRAVTILLGIDAEDLLLDALTDPSPLVRKKALWGLRTITSTHPRLVSYMTDVLQGTLEVERMLHEPIFSTLSVIGANLKDAGALEEAVLRTLKPRSLLGKIGKAGLSDALASKACEILGCLGTEQSIPTLRRIEQGRSQGNSEAAARAIEQIRIRMIGSDTKA